MPREVEIVLRSGKKDWIDPVEVGGIQEDEYTYYIDNGYHVYPYAKSEVAEIRINETK